jgi:hypothetical protein
VLRGLLSPVVVIVLVVVASVTDLVGMRLQDAGAAPQLVVTVVYDAVPQGLCLIAIARLLAELAWSGRREAPGAAGPPVLGRMPGG